MSIGSESVGTIVKLDDVKAADTLASGNTRVKHSTPLVHDFLN